jgi:chromosome segregation ATPase
MKKDVVLVILGLLVVGLSVFLARSLEKEHRAVKGLEEERYSRMVAEESLQKNASKLSTMEAQIKSASDKMAKIQDIVEQQKGVNADLKKQYAQLAEAKEALEAKVKVALQEQAAHAPVAAPAK